MTPRAVSGKASWFKDAWREYEEVTRPRYEAKLQAWAGAGGFGPPPPHPVRPHVPGYLSPRDHGVDS